MNFESYPLQFKPILKERIWGGTKLKTMFNKPIPSDATGESWEISAVDGNVSEVSTGAYAGKSLTELLEVFPVEILGADVHERFGKKFPLLFKFLDAHQNLSVQVHPNDEVAKKRHDSFGKTEMWYIMQADANAKIIIGFEHDSSPQEYLKSLQNHSILNLLHTVNVKKGEMFFIDTGTIHGIGAGIVIAEIQQTSDITYRIYDYDRKDATGKTRELHTDLAVEAINYHKTQTKKSYDSNINQSNQAVKCNYFTTDYFPLDGEAVVKKEGKSFTVYMCVEGSLTLECNDLIYKYNTGDTFLIPAAILNYKFSGKATLLEIYIS